MLFAHDTDMALASSAALANTAREDPDTLSSLAMLEDFMREWKWTGRRPRTRAELDDVRALRHTIDGLWTAEEDDVVDIVNGMLRDARALPQLVRHDGWDYHLHATAADAPIAQRMAVEAAMAFIDVVRLGELDRLRRCDATDCDDLLLDLSKNRSRRFCSTTCSNRMSVQAYRQRRSGRG